MADDPHGPIKGDEFARLALDYEQTLAYWRQLSDTRFKLLTLVPVATAAGIGITSGTEKPAPQIGTAAVALVAILGIAMYDLRNSIFYDSAIHRAKGLESSLGFGRMSQSGDPGKGGLFSERPRARMRLAGISVWHDRALFLIYGAAGAGWALVLARGTIGAFGWPASSAMQSLVLLGTATGSFAAFEVALHRASAQWERLRSTTLG